MDIRNTIDRLKHSRISKSDDSEHEKKSHDEMAKKYESKKKFHSAHNQDRPKEESAKEKVLKSVFSHGKKLAVKARQKAQEEAVRQSKKPKKQKKQSGGIGNRSRPEQFSFFGFGGNMENFGYEMFSKKKSDESKEQPKEQFSFGFGNSDVPLDEMFDFRPKKDHSFKKRKSDVLDNVWNPKDFWN